jgi:hypothetical protein
MTSILFRCPGREGGAPRADAVITSFGHDDLFPAGISPGYPNRVIAHIRPVFPEGYPIGGRDPAHHPLCQFHPKRRRKIEAISFLSLTGHGFFYIRIIIANDHRPVGTEVIDVLVAVYIPEPASLRSFDKARTCSLHKKVRTLMVRETSGDDPFCPVIKFFRTSKTSHELTPLLERRSSLRLMEDPYLNPFFFSGKIVSSRM